MSTNESELRYVDHLLQQATHLAQWKPRIRPDLFKAVEDYCMATNARNAGALGKHRVFRGLDLDYLFRTWPELGDAYPAPGSVDAAEETGI